MIYNNSRCGESGCQLQLFYLCRICCIAKQKARHSRSTIQTELSRLFEPLPASGNEQKRVICFRSKGEGDFTAYSAAGSGNDDRRFILGHLAYSHSLFLVLSIASPGGWSFLYGITV